MLEKKHLVFLAGATAPFAPPLCTALQDFRMGLSWNDNLMNFLFKLPVRSLISELLNGWVRDKNVVFKPIRKFM